MTSCRGTKFGIETLSFKQVYSRYKIRVCILAEVNNVWSELLKDQVSTLGETNVSLPAWNFDMS